MVKDFACCKRWEGLRLVKDVEKIIRVSKSQLRLLNNLGRLNLVRIIKGINIKKKNLYIS